MATTYASEYSAFGNGGALNRKLIDRASLTELMVVSASFVLAAQPAADLLYGPVLPAGFRPLFLELNPSATLGSSTLAVGISGTAAKYRAAATLTAASGLIALPPAQRVRLASFEEILTTIAAATLPGSGALQINYYGING